MIYLTSDTHFGHDNILGFAHRPFKDIYEHDETLIENWNSAVGHKDDVYVLGDFAFSSADFAGIFKRLKGHKHLIIGNHDENNMRKLKNLGWKEISYSTVIKWNHIHCFLSHYPLLAWPGNYRFFPNFHGHVHLIDGNRYSGSDRPFMESAPVCQYDVGVDLNGFTPISIEDAIAKVKEQTEANMNTFNFRCV